MKVHLKVSMRFSKALAETINVLVYGKFPETLTIDHTRNMDQNIKKIKGVYPIDLIPENL